MATQKEVTATRMGELKDKAIRNGIEKLCEFYLQTFVYEDKAVIRKLSRSDLWPTFEPIVAAVYENGRHMEYERCLTAIFNVRDKHIKDKEKFELCQEIVREINGGDVPERNQRIKGSKAMSANIGDDYDDDDFGDFDDDFEDDYGDDDEDDYDDEDIDDDEEDDDGDFY